MTKGNKTIHNFTVDVEEYFQVSALEPFAPRSRWDSYDSRVSIGVDKLLALLENHDARATFFVLGWIGKRHPDLIRRIVEQGHEVASHGWGHRKVTDLRREEFRQSVKDSKSILEDLTGQDVCGYRAPSFSIVPGMEWALDVLLDEGYSYDSSLFPVRRDGYGYPQGSRELHRIERPGGTLWEVPPTTLRRFGQNLPAAGGAYFRLFPYFIIRKAFRETERDGQAGTFYIHPWELDPDQPRFPVDRFTRIRHYGGQKSTEARLGRLLSDFRFSCIRETLDAGTDSSEIVDGSLAG